MQIDFGKLYFLCNRIFRNRVGKSEGIFIPNFCMDVTE